MKPFKKLLLLFLTISALLATSCKKDNKNSGQDDNNPGSGQTEKNLVTYTIDGGTFHKQKITIDSDPKALQNGAFTGNYLKINLDDAPADAKASPKWSVDIAFNKMGTGMAKVNDPIPNATSDQTPNTTVDKRVYFLLQVQVDGKSKVLSSDTKYPEKTPGKITITKFGSKGGTIEGNFEGTLQGNSAKDIYTITEGHFVVTRKS